MAATAYCHLECFCRRLSGHSFFEKNHPGRHSEADGCDDWDHRATVGRRRALVVNQDSFWKILPWFTTKATRAYYCPRQNDQEIFIGKVARGAKDIKKTALRPFSFERTGGPPPSVVFTLSSVYLWRADFKKATRFLAKMIFGVGFDFPFQSSALVVFSSQAFAALCVDLFKMWYCFEKERLFFPANRDANMNAFLHSLLHCPLSASPK